ncbi:MAG: 5-formyltetrahydrofolate cyclo-ligase [Candidatus Altimarinota bacterium]
MELVQQKKRLRQEMKEIMGFVTDTSERSVQLLENVLKAKLLKKGQLVSVFVPMEDEVDTIPLVEYCWENGISVSVPEFQSQRQDPFILRNWERSDHLYETQYGIFHPRNSKTFTLEEVDLVFVPGMAFTKKGVRLGRGKGFYDHMLSQYDGKKVGLCFQEQIKENIPFDERDVLVDVVIAC